MASALYPPPGTDLFANKGSQILIASCITWSLAVVAVALRFTCRRMSGASFWWDDWLMLPALAGTTVVFATTIPISHALGQHVWTIGYQAQVDALHLIFVDEILYTLILFFVKVSILALYWRIFNISDLRIPIIITAVFVTIWLIASEGAGAFQCVPSSKFWDIFSDGKCFDSVKFYYGTAIPNILMDAVLFILPLPVIWKLNVSRSQKFLIFTMFALGGFVIVVSCVRLYLVVNLDLTSIDISWNFTSVIIWSATEINIAIVSGCLPCLRPVISFVRTGSFKSSRASSSSHSTPKERQASWGRRSSKNPTVKSDERAMSLEHLKDNESVGYERTYSQEG